MCVWTLKTVAFGNSIFLNLISFYSFSKFNEKNVLKFISSIGFSFSISFGTVCDIVFLT